MQKKLLKNWMIKNKGAEIDPKFTINKKVKLGILILVLNLFAGMFNVNSYPFSAYPKYSALIPNKIQFIRFNAKNNGVDTFFEAKKSGFRWEDYGWLENNLIQDFEKGKDVQKRLNDYWDIWIKTNPQLKKCDTIQVYLIQRPVTPEGKNKEKVIKKMGVIIPK